MAFGKILSYARGMDLETADGKVFKINSSMEAIGFKILGIPHIGVRQRSRIIFSMLKLDKKDVVLDAGCGIGLYSFEVCGKVESVFGVDIESKKILQAKEIAKRSKKKINFEVGDLTKLKFNNKFDKVICSDVIEHIQDYRAAIAGISKSMKNNGLVVFTFPRYSEFNKRTYKQFGHVVPGYKEEEIKKIFEKNNLKIINKRDYSRAFTRFCFKINNYLLKRRVLAAILFYPLYLLSYLDIFSSKNDSDGIAILAKKQID